MVRITVLHLDCHLDRNRRVNLDRVDRRLIVMDSRGSSVQGEFFGIAGIDMMDNGVNYGTVDDIYNIFVVV